MNIRHYDYYGKTYTMKELVQISGKPEKLIRHRIAQGFTVEDALDRPTREELAKEEENYLLGAELPILFREPIPYVFPKMQPKIGKEYIAKAHKGTLPSSKTRLFFTINLDNGLPLIVYPGEFEMIGA